MQKKFSFRLQKTLSEEQSIFQSIRKDIQRINNQIKKFNSEDIPNDFIKLWEHYLKLMNSNIDKYEIDKLVENIKELKQSYLLNWALPHKKLEKIINYKNILLNNLLNKISLVLNTSYTATYPEQRSNYLTNLYEEKQLSLIEQINNIIETLHYYNDNNKLVRNFIESWNNDCDFIKNKILKDELQLEDIRQIQNIINKITNSLLLNFTIPHKQLEELLNILTFKNKYIYIFKK